jgi:hypothetical protein
LFREKKSVKFAYHDRKIHLAEKSRTFRFLRESLSEFWPVDKQAIPKPKVNGRWSENPRSIFFSIADVL